MLVIVLIFVLMCAKSQGVVQMKLVQASTKMQQQEFQAKILRRRETEMVAGSCSCFKPTTFLQEEFETLTQRYVSSHPKVHKDMQQILKKTDTDLGYHEHFLGDKVLRVYQSS